MREAALIAAAVAAALPVAAKARDAAVYSDDGPLRGSLRRDEPAPVYSTDPRDPWNRLFHLLYARKLRAQLSTPENAKAPWRSVTRFEGRPGLLDPRLFEAESGWSELISDSGLELGGGTTMHARRAGWRLVFRRFVRVAPEAGGERCLTEHVTTTHGRARGPSEPAAEGPCGWKGLPSGTTALLLETPLALSADGELHSVALLLAAQVRVVSP